jgi:ABC-type phosphate transport system ATPase subunit
MSETSPIYLDLDSPQDSRALEENNLIQRRVKEQLDELLAQFSSKKRNRIINAESFDIVDEISVERPSQCIFISGSRGSGKTTFLRSVVLSLLNKSDGKIRPLAYIDPTRIETNEHIFFTLLSKLDDMVARALRNKPLSKQESLTKGYRECLEKMSHGLKLLDNLGGRPQHQKEWEDAAWALKKGLINASGGQQLELYFHRLLEVAAEITGTETFVLAFDDIDTDSSKVDAVLELIRRYLTSPRLIVLVSGDIRLYSYLMTEHQLANLNSGSSEEYHPGRAKEWAEHLEQQLSIKLFPSQYRLELKTLNDLCASKDYPLVVAARKDEEEKSLREFVEEFFEKHFGLNSDDAKSYVDFFLTQPVRSVFQVLARYKKDGDSARDGDSPNVAQILANAYAGQLINAGVNFELVLEGSGIALAEQVFDLCQEHGDMETGFYLRPNTHNEKFNISAVFLASALHKYTMDKFSSALSYMLIGPACCTIFGSDQGSSSPERFKNYVGLSRGEPAHSVANHLSGYLVPASYSNAVGLNAGVLRLWRSIDSNRNLKKIGDEIHRVYTRSKTEDLKLLESVDRIINEEGGSSLFRVACLAANHRLRNEYSHTFEYLSIYTLLGVITELLASNDTQVSSVQKILTARTSRPTYIAPQFDEKVPGDDGDAEGGEEVGDEKEEEVGQEYKDTSGLIVEWLKLVRPILQNKDYSALMLGKVWTRLFFSLNQAADEGKQSMLSGLAMERFIWVLLNAFAVEEQRYRKDSKWRGNKLTNPRTSSQVLKGNLSGVSDDNAPMTLALATCPLLLAFLRFEELEQNGSLWNALKKLRFSKSNAKKSWSELHEKIYSNLHPRDSTDSNEEPLATLSRVLIVGTFPSTSPSGR